MSNASQVHRTGFTLIELLITMGIVVLILSVTLPAFSRFQKEQDLLAGAEIIRDALLEAQNLALAPRASRADTTTSYRVRFLPRTATESASYRVEEEVTPTNWTLVQSGALRSSVNFFHISECSLISRGVVYSIPQQGRITEPTNQTVIQLALTHGGLLTSEQQLVELQLETGRIDVKKPTTPLTERTCP